MEYKGSLPGDLSANLNSSALITFKFIWSNFFKKTDSDHEIFFGATLWSKFEYLKNNFLGFERRLKGRFIFLCYYMNNVTKTFKC
jgi:hypothetical protein